MDTAVQRKREKVIQWKLQRRFAQISHDLGARETAIEKWWNLCIESYTESHRHYHTLAHIHDMLECLDDYRSPDLVQDVPAMTLAIFFHDWVYDPKRKDNEIESIKCFQLFASEVGLSSSLSFRVAKYIERTITHTMPTPEDSMFDTDLRLFLDFDIEVLSRNEELYAEYSKQIRAEYVHLEPNEYYAGRARVLKSFLERDRLYLTELFYRLREQKAKANIRQEIAFLEDSLLQE